MTGDVAARATGFVAELNALFDGVFGVPEAFTSILVGGDDASRIGIAPFDSGRRGFGLFPLKRQVDTEARLFLRVEFDVALDDDAAHLMVRKSTFGFLVLPSPTWKTPTPMFRVEYDREPTGGKPPAHVHIHADSAELGWIIGSSGELLRRHVEIHFPVGGRRFRPTLEDVLLFLDHENLFTDWPKQDWRSHVFASRDRFDESQARATVRRHPEAAVAQLRQMGYIVGYSSRSEAE